MYHCTASILLKALLQAIVMESLVKEAITVMIFNMREATELWGRDPFIFSTQTP
jgi:hypothetical protein